MAIPARIHVILARESDNAVVFRRGPSNKVAVIGWNRNDDTFSVGQWFYGRIYEYRCDVSPDGRHILYFAAKYGRRNPLDETVEKWVTEEMGEIDWSAGWQKYHAYFEKRKKVEAALRKKHAKEISQMQKCDDYTDRSWTAISRYPYLKAIDLWFNGTGWNGGGLFIDNKRICLNTPPEYIAETVRHLDSRHFKEVQPPDNCKEWGWKGSEWGTAHGECPMNYVPRLERDGWIIVKKEEWGFKLDKAIADGLVLRKCFFFTSANHEPGFGCYYEEHGIYENKKLIIDGRNWRWADVDTARNRILYAENGSLFAIPLSDLNSRPVFLHDFNDMKYQRLAAPY